MEEEKERRILLKEAKESLWKRWRQRKERGIETWKESEGIQKRTREEECEHLERKLQMQSEQKEKKLKKERPCRNPSRRNGKCYAEL